MFSKNKKRLNWSNNAVKTNNNFYLNCNFLNFFEKLLQHALSKSNHNKIIFFIIFLTYGDIRLVE